MTIALWVLAAALLAPALIFCLQCWAALLPARRRQPLRATPRSRLAIVIPAHNEEQLLGETLSALSPQLAEHDHLLVVADNCADATADIARDAGVRVLERNDPQHCGKGYALSAGVAALKDDDYDVLVLIDADCHVEPGALDALARQAAAHNAPAQAVYLMEQCEGAGAREKVSAWAFMVKNYVRPVGLERLGLPCQLTGAGMAIPRAALTNISLASANIVEDMQLGLDLALAGYPPRLCHDARVIGRLPADGPAALRQRRRWEHGHMRTILTQAPRLLAGGLRRMRLSTLAMGLDLLVPPLSLLLVLLTLAAVGASVAAMFGVSPWPAVVLASALVALLLSVFVAWLRFGRKCLPARSLIGVAGYVIWKLPMYAMFLIRPEKKWVRTQRTPRLRDPAKTAA